MKITNVLNLPAPFLDAVNREYQYKDKQYSVTSILKGTREILLQRRHDNEITQDVSDMIWLIFGSAVHQILENGKETGTQLKENKLVVEVNDYKLSGIFDLYDDSTGTVTDYKTATCWKVIFNDWEDYKKQTLAYCWMLRKIGFNAHRGEIVAVLKDWSKAKTISDTNYPKLPVYKISWEFTEKDFEEIEEYILNKFAEIKECELLPDNELPLCSPKDRWEKPTIYAVMKKGRKTALKKFEKLEDAENMLKQMDGNHYIEKRKGEDSKCKEYCSACEFCDYYKENYGDIN